MIKVCDAIMGAGKSSAAIRYMNEHSDQKFIYITPYLDEASRIKTGCPKLKFVEPSDKIEKYNFRKSDHTTALIKEGKNITTTHQAFKRYSTETLDAIRQWGYTLIIDENYALALNTDLLPVSETVPLSIEIYGGKPGSRFVVYLSNFKERPSVEWLMQFAMKAYEVDDQ